MKTGYVWQILLLLASVAVGVGVGFLAGENQANRRAAVTSATSYKLRDVKRLILEECENHACSSVSEFYAPDMVELRKFIGYQLSSPEEAATIVKSFDVDEMRLFFGCVKDMTSGAK